MQGLTTGAGMWLAGATGVACGADHYELAVIATVLATGVLALLRPLEKKMRSNSPTAGGGSETAPPKSSGPEG